MGVIAGFLVSAFSGLTSLISIILARKAAFSIAYIAVYVAIAVAFLAIINSLLASLTASLPSNSFLLAGLSLLPSNTSQCIAIISTAHVASFAMTFKSKLLSLKVNA